MKELVAPEQFARQLSADRYDDPEPHSHLRARSALRANLRFDDLTSIVEISSD
jgi:hypothetical protein